MRSGLRKVLNAVSPSQYCVEDAGSGSRRLFLSLFQTAWGFSLLSHSVECYWAV
jgi:hypothetical protein